MSPVGICSRTLPAFVGARHPRRYSTAQFSGHERNCCLRYGFHHPDDKPVSG